MFQRFLTCSLDCERARALAFAHWLARWLAGSLVRSLVCSLALSRSLTLAPLLDCLSMIMRGRTQFALKPIQVLSRILCAPGLHIGDLFGASRSMSSKLATPRAPRNPETTGDPVCTSPQWLPLGATWRPVTLSSLSESSNLAAPE